MNPQHLTMDGKAVDLLYKGRPGARPEDWQHFAGLGLLEDLLPVVSDRGVGISPASRMQSIGKTPSRIGSDGLVVGIPKWTERNTTQGDVDRWQADGRHGICIQTRHVRAIDVDVDDPDLAADIAAEIEAALLRRLPRRGRPDSAKFLLAFRMEGEHRKRIIHTRAGIVEFLADGQQFVAIGTHPSGTRYRWQAGEEGATPEGLPLEVPELDEADFGALWAHLEARFGIEGSMTVRAPRPPSGAEDRDPTADDVVRYIEERGIVLGTGREGERYVRCPWEHEHTTGSGMTASVWFPAGSGGYELGHYKCLHAHCEHRGRGEFLAAIEYGHEDFEVVTADPQTGELLPPALPPFERVQKGADAGMIRSAINNVVAALRRPDVCGYRLGFDSFRAETVIAPAGTAGNEGWRPFADADYVAIRMHLEAPAGEGKPEGLRFVKLEAAMVRDAVLLVSKEHTFDSAQAWLLALPEWDGVPRIESFFVRYLGAADNRYGRELGLYLWTALPGRTMEPGIKADIVPILEGAQGIRKSTAVAAIAPAPDYFVEIGLGDKEEDLARKMRGALVAEIAELDGLHTRAIEGIKKFITRTHEKWVPKYREFADTFARRLVFIGTTNREDLLADETGNRRWAPIRVTKCDVDAIVRDREQLWAEGLAWFRLAGVCWQGVEDLLNQAQDGYHRTDPWEEAVLSWLESPDPFAEGEDAKVPRAVQPFTTNAVLAGALHLAAKDMTQGAMNRVAAILKRRGYSKRKGARDGGGRHASRPWVWVREG